MKKRMAKTSLILFATVACLILIVTTNDQKAVGDTIEYNGKTYGLLEYNAEIFNYNFIVSGNFDEDSIHPVSNKKWDAVYFGGDIFIHKKQVDSAIKYYADDSNYNWFVTFDEGDKEEKLPLPVTQKELKYIYNMENADKQNTMTFEDIEQFASIVKQSRDGFVFALITLARCDGVWYWKTEIMNDKDEEYIVPLPETLNKKLSDLVK